MHDKLLSQLFLFFFTQNFFLSSKEIKKNHALVHFIVALKYRFHPLLEEYLFFEIVLTILCMYHYYICIGICVEKLSTSLNSENTLFKHNIRIFSVTSSDFVRTRYISYYFFERKNICVTQKFFQTDNKRGGEE